MKLKIIVYVLVGMLLLEMFYLAGYLYSYYQLNKSESGPNPFMVLKAVGASEVGKYFFERDLPLSLDYNPDKQVMIYQDNETRLVIDSRNYQILEDVIK